MTVSYAPTASFQLQLCNGFATAAFCFPTAWPTVARRFSMRLPLYPVASLSQADPNRLISAQEMLRYFKGVHDALDIYGMFVLDAYGGPMSMEAMEKNSRDKTKIQKGAFTYVWEQHSFDAIDHSVVNHIHFEFPDGTALRKAFTYEWRFWTLPELRDLLAEAGFSSSTVYWEDEDEDGEGTGVYRPAKKAVNEGSWVAYIFALY